MNGGETPAGAPPPGRTAVAAPSARDWQSAAATSATPVPADASTGADAADVRQSHPAPQPPRAASDRDLPLEPVPPRAPAPAPAPAPTPASTPVPPAPTPAYSADWLLAQDGGSWVIQLFGSHERAAATRSSSRTDWARAPRSCRRCATASRGSSWCTAITHDAPRPTRPSPACPPACATPGHGRAASTVCANRHRGPRRAAPAAAGTAGCGVWMTDFAVCAYNPRPFARETA